MSYDEEWILKTGALAGLGVLLAIGGLLLIVVVLIYLAARWGGTPSWF